MKDASREGIQADAVTFILNILLQPHLHPHRPPPCLVTLFLYVFSAPWYFRVHYSNQQVLLVTTKVLHELEAAARVGGCKDVV